MSLLVTAGAYGTRQLRFCRTHGQSQDHQQPPASGSATTTTSNSSATATTSNSVTSASASASASASISLSSRTALHNIPVVAIGLKWPWHGGRAGNLAAVWELFHELGHATHLILSSAHQPFKHFGGLHLPLDVLEAPSSLFEKFLVHPQCVRIIFRKRSFEAGKPAALVSEQPDLLLPQETAIRLAAQYMATHYNALETQEQVS